MTEINENVGFEEAQNEGTAEVSDGGATEGIDLIKIVEGGVDFAFKAGAGFFAGMGVGKNHTIKEIAAATGMDEEDIRKDLERMKTEKKAAKKAEKEAKKQNRKGFFFMKPKEEVVEVKVKKTRKSTKKVEETEKPVKRAKPKGTRKPKTVTEE